MSKHITLILVIVAVVFYFIGNYFAPNKVKEKIVYKDRVEYIDRDIIKTEVITKDGETKIITEIKERIKEIEKEKEVIKYDNKKWIIGAGIGLDSQPNKYIQVDISRNIISNLYLTIGTASSLDTQVGYLGVKVLF